MGYEINRHSIKNQPPANLKSVYPFFLTALFGLTLFFGLLAYLYLPWQWPILWCLASSTAAFVLTGYDKTAARRGALRAPETVLYTAALIGGAAGVLLGMKIFRHKTRKASFQFVLAVIIVIQVAVWRYFLRNI